MQTVKITIEVTRASADKNEGNFNVLRDVVKENPGLIAIGGSRLKIVTPKDEGYKPLWIGTPAYIEKEKVKIWLGHTVMGGNWADLIRPTELSDEFIVETAELLNKIFRAASEEQKNTLKVTLI
ncbi:MAG TPA: hypothetical protein PKD00_00590 [Burkholderiales bacterium]|nr:hypothetical protein [Burkholderiales bacterium]